MPPLALPLQIFPTSVHVVCWGIFGCRSSPKHLTMFGLFGIGLSKRRAVKKGGKKKTSIISRKVNRGIEKMEVTT